MTITTNDNDKISFIKFLEEGLQNKGYMVTTELTVMPFFGEETSISIFDAMICVEDRWVLNLNFTCGGILVKDENNHSLARFGNEFSAFKYIANYFYKLAKEIA